MVAHGRIFKAQTDFRMGDRSADGRLYAIFCSLQIVAGQYLANIRNPALAGNGNIAAAIQAGDQHKAMPDQRMFPAFSHTF